MTRQRTPTTTYLTTHTNKLSRAVTAQRSALPSRSQKRNPILGSNFDNLDNCLHDSAVALVNLTSSTISPKSEVLATWRPPKNDCLILHQPMPMPLSEPTVSSQSFHAEVVFFF